MAFLFSTPRSAWVQVMTIWFALAAVFLTIAPALQAAEPGGRASLTWIGPQGSPLPFKTYEEIEEFLRSAKITGVKTIQVGINETKRVTLEKDGVQMTAAFRDVDIFKHRFEDPKGLRLNFRDSCIYECAAYQLSKLIGLPHVPPVVRRTVEREDFKNQQDFGKFKDREGTIQAWVEGAFTEKDRMNDNRRPPDMGNWAQQHQLMAIFDNLIFNDDRNLGNILIDPDWKIWFIDSTRGFRPFSDLRDPEKIKRCDRTVWENLQKVSEEQLDASLGELLRDSELRPLKARRLKLIEHIQSMIDQFGEDAVLFTLE